MGAPSLLLSRDTITMVITVTMDIMDCTITMGRDQQTLNHQLLPNRPTSITMATTPTMDTTTMDTTHTTMDTTMVTIMESDQLMPRHPTSTTTDTTHTTTGTITDTTTDTIRNKSQNDFHSIFLFQGSGYLTKS